jgi:hypothetical protein
LLPRDFVCALPDDRESNALAEFVCPICDRAVFNPLTPQEAKLLMLLGAEKANGAAPLELTEEKVGPPLTHDEVFDLHVAMAELCCPQAELIDQ